MKDLIYCDTLCVYKYQKQFPIRLNSFFLYVAYRQNVMPNLSVILRNFLTFPVMLLLRLVRRVSIEIFNWTFPSILLRDTIGSCI